MSLSMFQNRALGDVSNGAYDHVPPSSRAWLPEPTIRFLSKERVKLTDRCVYTTGVILPIITIIF
jgi:hypothetical protein